MRILYVANVDIHNTSSYGIIRKIFGQINAFQKMNYAVDLSIRYRGRHYLIRCDQDTVVEYGSSIRDNFLNTIAKKDALSTLQDNAAVRDYRLVYIRFVALNLSTFIFIKRMKSIGCKALLEIPTYPYLHERYTKLAKDDFLGFVSYFKSAALEFFITVLLRRYLDFIVLTIPKKSLWRIPVISIENGIEIDKIPVRRIHQTGSRIVLITATNIDKWQGIDRLVKGMHQYYQGSHALQCIELVIVGDGPQKKNLAHMVNKLELDDYVKFLDRMKGRELFKMYDQATMAVGSLGRHRQKTNTVSTLKVKEYCAIGIPFIYSNDEPTLSGNEPFALKLPADDSPVRIEDVIAFYYKIRSDRPLIENMRTFALRYDWFNQIGIIDKALWRGMRIPTNS
jgi:glycosyltransferase involved in cell wall biosynthesis